MIKIKSGIYGFRNERGFIEPKTPQSSPFSLTPSQEEELVKKGVAEYVEAEAPAPTPAPAPQVETKKAEAPKNLHFAKIEVVQAEAEKLGIETNGLKKAELIAKIKEVQGSTDDNDTDDVVEDDEPAPDFDPMGAIK